MRSGHLLDPNLRKYFTEAQTVFEHLRIFRKGLLFLDGRYRVEFKGFYQIYFLQTIFYNVICSPDSGFDYLSKLCDKFRAKAVTKEDQNDALVDATHNLRFCNQIAVLKKALARRQGTIKVEPELLQPKEFYYPPLIKEVIPECFVRVDIKKNQQFSSCKACLINTANCGGSYAILNNDLRSHEIYYEFVTHRYHNLELNPTIWHIINKTPVLRKKIRDICLDLCKDYHVCNNPKDCTRWDLHPACLMTQVSFRGGKVRPLTMFLPEINYLGSLMKNTFKAVLKENIVTDLFVNSKYYYSEIERSYHAGDWIHSGDLRSCTNLMDPRLSKEVLWDVWVHTTGKRNPMYRRILDICFSFYKLVELDDELDDIRKHLPIEEKKGGLSKMDKDRTLFKTDERSAHGYVTIFLDNGYDACFERSYII